MWRDACAEGRNVDRSELLLAWMEGGEGSGVVDGRVAVREVNGGGRSKVYRDGYFLHEGRSTGFWREFIETGHFVRKGR